MDKARRDEARKRCEAATPGPICGGNAGSFDEPQRFMSQAEAVEWFRELLSRSDNAERPIAYVQQAYGEGLTIGIFGNGPTSYDNASFWAHARTDLPAALDALDEAERRIAELEAETERLASIACDNCKLVDSDDVCEHYCPLNKKDGK
jgi:hypothetical protein